VVWSVSMWLSVTGSRPENGRRVCSLSDPGKWNCGRWTPAPYYAAGSLGCDGVAKLAKCCIYRHVCVSVLLSVFSAVLANKRVQLDYYCNGLQQPCNIGQHEFWLLANFRLLLTCWRRIFIEKIWQPWAARQPTRHGLPLPRHFYESHDQVLQSKQQHYINIII